MVGVEGAHRFLSAQIRKLLMQCFEAVVVALEISRILRKGLEVENGDQFLACSKPEQIDAKQWVVEVVGWIGNGVEHLQTVASIQACHAPATKPRHIPQPASNFAVLFV